MNGPEHARLEAGVTIVVPCYNEQDSVASTIQQIRDAMKESALPWEIIAVNDASTDATGERLDALAGANDQVKVVHAVMNRGYGASLKAGIALALYDRVVITDADGTYPNNRIPELIAILDRADMAVGARIGANVNIPFVRRPVKWMLLRYARWLSRADIKDVNSGLRAVWTRHVHRVWSMLPSGFSFTTTITIALHVNQLHVVYLPIDYYKRVGTSSIRPVRDTARFFFLVLRSIMFFRPLQVFGAFGILLCLLGITVGIIGLWLDHRVPDVAAVSLFTTGVNFFGLGLLGDLVNSRRFH
jgi:glycosyltransferase involved in cell wall biosynthesis